MSVYCRLKIAVLFAALAANAGDGRQLLFGQIESFDHPRLAKVFAGFRVVGSAPAPADNSQFLHRFCRACRWRSRDSSTPQAWRCAAYPAG